MGRREKRREKREKNRRGERGRARRQVCIRALLQQLKSTVAYLRFEVEHLQGI